MSANNRQVGGSHYAGAVQHWDMAYVVFGEGYFGGQITKYVSRWRKKNGVQDLEKAAHFLDKLIEVRQRRSWCVRARMWLYDRKRASATRVRVCEAYLDANSIIDDEYVIIVFVADGCDESLLAAREILRDLILRQYTGSSEPTRAYVDQG